MNSLVNLDHSSAKKNRGAFILGASRCGSTMVSEIIKSHPDILSVSELLACQGTRALLNGKYSGDQFWRQLSGTSHLMRKLANPDASPDEFLYHKVNSGRFDPFDCPPLLAVTLPHITPDPDAMFDRLMPQVSEFPRQTLPNHYRGLFGLMMAETNAKMWVERSGGSLLATQSLIELFPEARFVMIARDGKDVALSMQKYKPIRFVIWFWKLARRAGIDILKPAGHIGRSKWLWFMEVATSRFMPIDKILNTNTAPNLKDCAGFWSALTMHGLKSFERIPASQRMMLHYEDLIETPRTKIRALEKFLDVSTNPEWLDIAAKIPQHRPPRWQSLPAAEQKELHSLTDTAIQETARIGLSCLS